MLSVSAGLTHYAHSSLLIKGQRAIIIKLSQRLPSSQALLFRQKKGPGYANMSF